jgi:CMP-N-acetylneuraminic acid synthetase
VPRKNLERLDGATLVRRALETTLAADCLDTVALSSDDDEVLDEAQGLNVVRIKRPPALATDEARTLDVVLHVLESLDGAERFDGVAVVQATSPFTAPEDIAATVNLLERTGAESAVSIVRVESALHPLKLKRLEGDRLVPWLAEDAMTPSHDLPPLWVRNGSVYATRRHVLERGELVSLRDCRGHEMPLERSFDIDTARDLAFARFLRETGAA